jgi:small subunit ribosomal protein S12
MSTLNQLIKKGRTKKKRSSCVFLLDNCPQKKGVIVEVRNSVSPKKPNSAKRKVAKIRLTSTNKFLIAVIPGMGHNLQKFSVVLVRGGHARDIPGVRYKLIKGKYDFHWKENTLRSKSRSKYGIKIKDYEEAKREKGL